MLNSDPKKIRGDLIWFKVPISQLVGERNGTLIKSIVSYYLTKTGKHFETNNLSHILPDKNEIEKLMSFFTSRPTTEKIKKLTFQAFLALGELYSKYGFYENSILIWKAAYTFAPSIAKKKLIREKLVEDVRKSVMNFVNANKMKAAMTIILDHILYVASRSSHGLSDEEGNEIRSLMISTHTAQKILIQVNKITKKRKNLAMNEIVKIIKRSTL